MFLKVLTQRYLCFIMYNLWISDIQPWLNCPFCFHLFIYFSHCFMTTKIEPNQRWGQCSASYPIYSFIWSADNSIQGGSNQDDSLGAKTVAPVSEVLNFSDSWETGKPGAAGVGTVGRSQVYQPFMTSLIIYFPPTPSSEMLSLCTLSLKKHKF